MKGFVQWIFALMVGGYSGMSFAAIDIYAYAIRCQNTAGTVRISVHPLGERFAFLSRGLDGSVNQVFVESGQKSDLSARTLAFVPAADQNADLKLYVTKVQQTGSGFKGRGQVTVDQQTYALLCDLRYAFTEEDFNQQKLAQWADEIL